MRLTGPRLVLRSLQPADATSTYVSWLNDPEVVRHTESRFARHTTESVREFIQSAQDDGSVFLAITLRENNAHIGNIKLGPIDSRHRRADIGLIIGEKNCWGRGYGTEAIELLARHAFDDLRLHKLTAGCYASNIGSRRAFEKAGFVLDGVRKDECLVEGRWEDVMLLAKWNPDAPLA